eukprot:scaffold2180_cov168-Amphora_coffeaeformis.AAC.4
MHNSTWIGPALAIITMMYRTLTWRTVRRRKCAFALVYLRAPAVTRLGGEATGLITLSVSCLALDKRRHTTNNNDFTRW